MFFKVFLRKIISTISNSSYTSQIHYRNALRLDPVKTGLSIKCIKAIMVSTQVPESFIAKLEYSEIGVAS